MDSLHFYDKRYQHLVIQSGWIQGEASIVLTSLSFFLFLQRPDLSTVEQSLEKAFYKAGCSGFHSSLSEEVETVSHLFLKCKKTTQLWRIFVRLGGISWVMPNKITHLLYCWEEARVGAANRDRWRIVPACI